MAQRIARPFVDVQLRGITPTAALDQKITTFIGQKLPAGSAAAGVLLEDIDVYAANSLFGAGSMLANMINNFIKINTVSQVNVIALEDAVAAVEATGAVAFSGTATAAGTFDIYVGSDDRHYSLDVSVGDTDGDVGDALVTAITADLSALVSAVNTAGSVALEAVNGGTVGNSIGIRYEGAVEGLTVALTAMAGGATDPSMTGLAALLVKRTDVVMPYEYGLDDFVDLMDARFNVFNDILDGRVFSAVSDDKAAVVAIGEALNSQSLVLFADKPVVKDAKKGTAIFEMKHNIAAQFAAVRALRLLEDPARGISDWVIANDPKDQISGPHLNGLPFHNTPLDLPVIPTGEGWTDNEVADLSDAGISVVGNNLADNGVICGDIYTTYKTNAQGVPDPSYEYLNYMDTATAAREYIAKSLRIDYSQRRLTNGRAVGGYAFADANVVRADMKKYYLALAGEGYVLLQQGPLPNGKQVIDVYMANLDVTLDAESGAINIYGILPIVSQVRSLIVPLQINFNPQAL